MRAAARVRVLVILSVWAALGARECLLTLLDGEYVLWPGGKKCAVAAAHGAEGTHAKRKRVSML